MEIGDFKKKQKVIWEFRNVQQETFQNVHEIKCYEIVNNKKNKKKRNWEGSNRFNWNSKRFYVGESGEI